MDKNPSKNNLERSVSPESVGIDSRAIIDFFNECEAENIELHSFMLLRHGKVAVQAWWAPFNPQTPHTMFSFSKSVVGTAIGFAIDEGKVSLSTNVYGLFPEYALKRKKKYEDVLNVEHLLTMTSGKASSILINTEKVGWVKSFLRAPFKDTPGENFEYVTGNSFMLAAIIKKITGQSVVDYLTPRLFEPLGIDIPFWEKNQSGIEVGGWGLYFKTEDQAKFVQCYLDNGKWKGKQVIPEDWAKTVGQQHVEKTPGVSADHAEGYGYQFWLNSLPNSYRCDGLFSQFGIVMKDQDACIVTTAGEPLEDKVLEIIWRHFPKGFSEQSLPENPDLLAKLQQKTAGLSLPTLPEFQSKEGPDKVKVTEREKEISGKFIKFRLPGLATVLGMVDNAFSTKRSGGFNNVQMTFEKNCLKFFWTEKYDENTIDIGYNGKNIVSKGIVAGRAYDFAASCAWHEDGSLEIWIRPLQLAQMKKLLFTFDGENVKMAITTEKGLYDLALFGLDFKGIEADDLIFRLAKGAASVAEPIVEPDLNGKFFEQISEE